MAYHRPYQGYPYTDPPVNDAPSIDAATASRWADLPRRKLSTSQGNANSDISQSQTKKQRELDENPVIYIDVPDSSSSDVAEPVETSTEAEEAQHSSQSRQDKKHLEGSPVIYIDVPESSSSPVAQRVTPEDPGEPEYVQETIFYNPFDNRRIDQSKDAVSVRSSDSEGSSRPALSSSRPRLTSSRVTRPTPPSTLNLTSPGSSGYYPNPGLPSSEAYVYQSNGFPASPIPVSEFPHPPPAYTEIEPPVGGVTVPTESPVESPGTHASEPPRTVVITQGTDHLHRTDEPSPIGLPNPLRKVVYCQHCGHRVHTLVIRQTGAATHVIALSFLCIGLFPVTILVYLTDTCKNKNHYCPNCNEMIGYEAPVFCRNMTYTK